MTSDRRCRNVTQMKELYADFNDFAANGALPLTCAGSVESIADLTEPLQDGEEVWLTDGELRATGRVRRREDGSWEASVVVGPTSIQT